MPSVHALRRIIGDRQQPLSVDNLDRRILNRRGADGIHDLELLCFPRLQHVVDHVLAPLDGAAAEQVAKQFVEVLIAPEITPAARAVFASKQNVRLLEVPLSRATNALDFKRVGGGMLLQSSDAKQVEPSELRVVSKKQPTVAQMADLQFAWKVAKYVKSNAIVFCKGGMTMGVGAGQMSRLDSARIASIKAGHAGLTLQGTVVASDAFFPFRDGLDVVVDAGATCVIQPGGSMRDNEVIDAANERGVAMVFSGVRHFRH